MLLGAPHPDHLTRQLTSRQLAEWEAYLSIEPRGERRADLRMQRLCGAIAASQGAEVREEDFKLEFRPVDEQPLTAEELTERIKQRFAAAGCRGLSERFKDA